jgi:hypothetical protein
MFRLIFLAFILSGSEENLSISFKFHHQLLFLFSSIPCGSLTVPQVSWMERKIDKIDEWWLWKFQPLKVENVMHAEFKVSWSSIFHSLTSSHLICLIYWIEIRPMLLMARAIIRFWPFIFKWLVQTISCTLSK